MRIATSFACISLVSLLSACVTPDNGYYDAHGNWIANNPNNANRAHAPLPGGLSEQGDPDYTFDRRGYYDYNGYYMDKNDGFSIPPDMFPPRGMCRVWFTDRAPADQPQVESCNNIRSRVPAGAYVIYGG